MKLGFFLLHQLLIEDKEGIVLGVSVDVMRYIIHTLPRH